MRSTVALAARSFPSSAHKERRLREGRERPDAGVVSGKPQDAVGGDAGRYDRAVEVELNAQGTRVTKNRTALSSVRRRDCRGLLQRLQLDERLSRVGCPTAVSSRNFKLNEDDVTASS